AGGHARYGAALCADTRPLLRRGAGDRGRRAAPRAPRDEASGSGSVIWSWDFALAVLPDILGAFGVTLQATLVGFALAAALGLLWAVMRMAPVRLVARSASAVVEFVRSTPLLIQIYFL